MIESNMLKQATTARKRQGLPGMRISYNKLWKILIDKKMKKNDLRGMTRMGPNTMAKLGKDEAVSMDVLLRICEALKCDVGDIMEVLPDEERGGTGND